MSGSRTRRAFVGFGARTILVGGLCSQRAALRAFAATSLSKAYSFLDNMMDKYATGSTLRLSQSYVRTAALNLGDIGFTYDNAATLIAFLQRGQSDDLARATVLGESLVFAQGHDPIGDGRVRNSYHANHFILSNGSPRIGDHGTDTGNMAWTGLALAQLYQKTQTQSYLDAAVTVGNWVQTNTYDTRGAGGYTGGVTKQGKLLYKSTENNIDLHALFTMLASLTGDATWTTRAAYAHAFIVSMWNLQSSPGFFWTGTDTNGVTTNTSFIPEDCQSWSYLALEDPTYAASIDWAYSMLAAVDGVFSGVSFSNADTSGVWFEGTGHMAAALAARNAAGDAAKAAAFLADIQLRRRRIRMDGASMPHRRTVSPPATAITTTPPCISGPRRGIAWPRRREIRSCFEFAALITPCPAWRASVRRQHCAIVPVLKLLLSTVRSHGIRTIPLAASGATNCAGLAR